MRWGRSSAWVTDGQALAMNTALSMLVLGQRLSARLPCAGAEWLSEALTDMLDAQARDLTASEQHHEGLSAYLKIAGGKTGALLAFAARLGAHALPNDLQTTLSRWGFHLGVAHQIQDDLDDSLRDEDSHPSNVQAFLVKAGHSGDLGEVATAARDLASRYVTDGNHILSFQQLPEDLDGDLQFICRALGDRRCLK